MHSIPASTAFRSTEAGGTTAKGSAFVALPEKLPLALAHLSKNSRMSVTRSRITGRFFNGAMDKASFFKTRSTWVLQVQRGTPLTVMAQEPHIPTRHAKR